MGLAEQLAAAPHGALSGLFVELSAVAPYEARSSAALGGSASLAGVPTPMVPGSSAALTGTASLAAQPTLRQASSAALAGAGALAAAPLLKQNSAAALTGSAGLAAAGTAGSPSSVGMTGTGALAASPTLQQNSTAALTGAGALVPVPRLTQNSAAALAGSGALAAAPRLTQNSAAALAGSGALTAAAKLQQNSTAALAGAGALVVSPSSTVALTGVGSVVVTLSDSDLVTQLGPFSRIRADQATVVSSFTTQFNEMSTRNAGHTLAAASGKRLGVISTDSRINSRALAVFTTIEDYISSLSNASWGFLHQDVPREVFLVGVSLVTGGFNNIMGTKDGSAVTGMFTWVDPTGIMTFDTGALTASNTIATPSAFANNAKYALDFQSDRTLTPDMTLASTGKANATANYTITLAAGAPQRTMHLGGYTDPFAFAEWIIFDRVLSTTHRTIVTNYLTSYYGL